ncbi:GPN-loop GTPase 1 [Perkinsus olseni]|uniref:GPN-loop GTPase n=1 Tax=Perkinsus olseni TaxID=32597 RepID=A0A7J6MW29_PEROL|nr:GPN-loop GTPase 1 [Perkinsus olseni]KAF4675646.1 GPN-loop GTPase 1 [Perkinsus olseni]
MADTTAAASSSSSAQPMEGLAKDATGHKPTVIVVIGMAGAGKSTFVHRLYLHLTAQKKRVYSVNLDPAVRYVPYPTNIDIRDTVKYKDVMKHFGLGPNGAIMTSLNLFATRFDQAMGLIDQRASELDYVIVDTPGQIEVFNWSASGTIILDSLAMTYPTVTLFVLDTVRCTSPTTFMSNMLYVTSIMYKTKLPTVAVFNKCDVHPSDSCTRWMSDWESYIDAVRNDEQNGPDHGGGYMSSLMRSMAINISEFYENLAHASVSSLTGIGMGDCEAQIIAAAEEYEESYVPYLEARKTAIHKHRVELAKQQLKVLDKQDAKRKAQQQKAPTVAENREDDAEEVDEDEAEDLAKFREMLQQHAHPERATADGVAEEDEPKRLRK